MHLWYAHVIGVSSMNFNPGFSKELNYDFNYLMYADDLILMTSAIRKAAKNINLCLDIYSSLTVQKPNTLKYEIYFPDWFNHHVAKSICQILKFKKGNLPFTFFGVLISSKRLALSHFDNIIRKVNRACAGWKNAKIPKIGKTILINSSIMALPSYYLSVYPIPNLAIDKLSCSARKLLWANGSNGSIMSMVSWNNTTLYKAEGSLGIRNLRLAKHSWMAKNLFNFLNRNDNIWVDIMRKKYVMHKLWNLLPPQRCSWFFRVLCWTMEILKPNLWINVINPHKIYIL